MLKKTTIALSLLSVLAAPLLAEINWQYTISDAKVQAKKEKKKILLMVASPSCGYCTKMLNTTLSDEKVMAVVNKGFVPVMLNNVTDKLPSGLSVRGVPTIFILNSDAKPLGAAIIGFRESKDFLQAVEEGRGAK